MKFLLCALILPFLLFSQPIQTDLLVVLQDAGETYAILPVLGELEKEGVEYQVIAGGVAESLSLNLRGIPLFPMNTLDFLTK